MFNSSLVKKRYFEVQLEAEFEDGKTHTANIMVGPPTIKALRKMMSAADESSSNIEELRGAIIIMMRKNKTGYKVPEEYIDALDTDQMLDLLTAFFEWVHEEQKN